MLTLVTGYGTALTEYLRKTKTISVESKHSHPRILLKKLHYLCIDCETYPEKDVILYTNNIFVIRAAKNFAMQNNFKILLKEFIKGSTKEWNLSTESIHDMDLVLLGIEQYEEEVDLVFRELKHRKKKGEIK